MAVAVSGGADSLCLAWLAARWGKPAALIVDHGLRPESAEEAAITAARLASFGVTATILRLDDLPHGPGLAARARTARYAALTAAAVQLGLSDLLLGHHAGDQAETVLMRQRAHSGASGLAAMPLVAEHAAIRLVRPLLGMAPGRLRATLRQAGIGWVEDPSNKTGPALRTRLRRELDDPGGDGPAVAALCREAAGHAAARAATDQVVARTLAERACLTPEGYATLTPGPIRPECLRALIRMLSGRSYPPDSQALARLARSPGPATLGGVRLLPAGRLGLGLLLVREPACIGACVPARNGALWDGRFRLHADADLPDGASLGALGEEASRFRRLTRLPFAVLRTLPAVRAEGEVIAIPHLNYFAPQQQAWGWTGGRVRVTLCPAGPAAGAAWVGDAQIAQAHHVRLIPESPDGCKSAPTAGGIVWARLVGPCGL